MSQPAASSWMAQRSAAPLSSDASSPTEPIAVPHRGSFEGLLTFRGSACILGSLTGGVNARGRLRIGPNARVDADVVVDELIVEGNLRGDVRARERIELGPRARVEGRLEAPRVMFRDGCRFRGPCRSGSSLSEVELP